MGARTSRFAHPPPARAGLSPAPALVATFLLLAAVWAFLFLGNVWGLAPTGPRAEIRDGGAAKVVAPRSPPAVLSSPSAPTLGPRLAVVYPWPTTTPVLTLVAAPTAPNGATSSHWSRPGPSAERPSPIHDAVSP